MKIANWFSAPKEYLILMKNFTLKKNRTSSLNKYKNLMSTFVKKYVGSLFYVNMNLKLCIHKMSCLLCDQTILRFP